MDDNNIIINQQVSLPYPFGAHKAFPLDSRSFFSNMEEAQAAVHDAIQLQRNQNGDFVLPNEDDGGADSVYYYGEPIVVAENNAEIVGLYIITKALDEHDEPYGVLQNVCSGLDSEYLRKDEANELINGLIQDYTESHLNTDCIDDYLFTNAIDDCGNILPTDGLYAYGLKETNGVLEKCETTKKVLSFDPKTPYNKNTNPLATLETVNNKAEELKEYVDEHIGGGMVPILYSELVEIRDNSQLAPGTFYRITDYTCSTTQENTQSAGHVFDIIVRADDENHLNENAFAAHHDGDMYFQDSKLEAWQLKYCLDNDKNRFAWADTENGKGVIYNMKDEWDNECPYDFKNIMFKRWAVTADQEHPYFVVDNADNNYGYYYGAKTLDGYNVLETATYGKESDWFYTFALKDLASNEWYDYTVVAHLGLKNDEGIEMACYDNHIVEGTDEYNSGKGEIVKMLNNIVFFNCYGDLSDTSYSDDYSFCNNNRFLGKCHSNTFGKGCYNNSFGNNCYSNSFGNDCSSNSFGNNFSQNMFGDYCHGNLSKNDCYSNSFGKGCYNNLFGNNCRQNSFENYCQTITVFNGVQYCSVTGGSQRAPVKNAQILNGTKGTSSQNKLTINFAANKSYTQIAGLDSTGNIRIWNPADPVTLPSNLAYIG